MPLLITALGTLLGLPLPARCGSHLWVINELFSSADGSVQFIEMHVPTNAADETNIAGRWVHSNSTGSQFSFPQNLPPGSTAFAYLLLATQSFADLPGAPTPDYIIPEGFFSTTSDLLRYWLYVTGDLTLSPGQLPVDGVSSLQRDGTTAVNSPTNFSGATGSVDLNAVAVPAASPAASGSIASLRVLAGSDGASFDIEFELAEAAVARLDLVDIQGRTVRHVFEGMASGVVRRTWAADDDTGRPVASGVYFVRLETAEGTAARKVAVVR
jgi:hypothetical protein